MKYRFESRSVGFDYVNPTERFNFNIREKYSIILKVLKEKDRSEHPDLPVSYYNIIDMANITKGSIVTLNIQDLDNYRIKSGLRDIKRKADTKIMQQIDHFDLLDGNLFSSMGARIIAVEYDHHTLGYIARARIKNTNLDEENKVFIKTIYIPDTYKEKFDIKTIYSHEGAVFDIKYKREFKISKNDEDICSFILNNQFEYDENYVNMDSETEIEAQINDYDKAIIYAIYFSARYWLTETSDGPKEVNYYSAEMSNREKIELVEKTYI